MKLKNYKTTKISLVCSLKLLILTTFAGIQFGYSQNSCATAIPITQGNYTVDAINGSNISTTCSTAALGEWYSYTPLVNHSVTVSSDLPENSCKDTNFSVYTGTCNGLTCYAEDDDGGNIICTNNNQSYLSTKTFDAMAGVTYYIVWDNKWSTTGFAFKLTEAAFVPSPCSTATAVTAGITSVAAIDGANINTNCSSTSQAKWYAYSPSQDYHVTVSSDLAVNLCKNTNFSVYTGSCSGGLTCVSGDDDSGILVCDSGNNLSNLSKKSFNVTAGTIYYIVWDDKYSADGFDFELIEAPIVYPVTYTAQNIGTINSGFNNCVVDMNGDSLDDIVGVSNNALKIHYQNTNGTFTVGNFTVPGTGFQPDWSIAAGDYNKDGFNDLLLGSSNGLTFWRSNATGTAYTSVTPGQYIFCQRTNFVDINNDGNLDAFSCHDINPNVYYINNGTGGMTYYQSGVTSGAYSLGITPGGGNYASLWTDYDNDGDVDMFISKCSGPPCELHRNDGNGVFTDVSALAGINVTPIQSWSSAIADFDNDGDMDIIIGSNGAVGHKFFRNDLDTSNSTEEAFTNITLGSGWDTDGTNNRDYIAYDFDNNGFVDVLGSGGKIMFNQGDNTFAPSEYPAISVGGVGDLNNDGFLDIQIGNTIQYAVPNGNHWIKVALKGVQSNSNGIAARVEIYGAWGKQMRDIRSGEGFEFMSSLNAHFGIGSATAIDKVVITWPSGTIDVINNPAIDSMLKITEASFPLAITEAENESFIIYPNPAGDTINIKTKSNAGIIKAEIYDLTGKLILKKESVNSSIPVNSLSNGTYMLKVLDVNGHQYTQKFVKS
ncbi:MAG: RNA-binding protein [Flavobacterium sp. BFFFF1]|uniref:FG-GAP-like repeat-containing protein n=1 Tax=Flavobacterium sp. BFFFF1 TaxID=2015557 RepID=UPI000BD8A759|nr:FG-GAP-like repeat-containing protein [Flavobacterium sp. BFFFF1]OYU80579.1 MAG: RNA-binding protein [Flavobacterium sp. BFFFF1]